MLVPRQLSRTRDVGPNRFGLQRSLRVTLDPLTRDDEQPSVDFAHLHTLSVTLHSGLPAVIEVLPTQIGTPAGQTVSIMGRNLCDGNARLVSIKLQGADQRITSATPNMISFECTDMQASGVFVGQVHSNMGRFTFSLLVQPPVINRVSKPIPDGNEYTAGEVCMVFGDNFGRNPERLRVALGAFKVPAVSLVQDHKVLSFKVPTGYGTGLPLTLTTDTETVVARETLDFARLKVISLVKSGEHFYLKGGPFPPVQARVFIGDRTEHIAALTGRDGKELQATIPRGTGQNLAVRVVLVDLAGGEYAVEVPSHVTFSFPTTASKTKYVRSVHDALRPSKRNKGP